MGNQMFQFAFALRTLQVSEDKRLYINGLIHSFMKDKRSVSLHHFHLTDKCYVCSKCQSYVKLLQFCFSVLATCGIRGTIDFFRKFYAFHRTKNGCVALNKGGIYFTTSSYDVLPVRNEVRDAHIYGGFMNVRVIDGMLGELRQVFSVKTPPSPDNQLMLNEIRACNAVCLHIRRGDYKLFPQLQVCNESYYANAVKLAVSELDSPVFYVFSTGHEDVEWVRKNYSFDAEVRYVDLDNPDYEELRLMMACKHFIVSNSTFSWWAAILSDAAGDEKRVWAPDEWLKGCKTDMLPETWTVLNTRQEATL